MCTLGKMNKAQGVSWGRYARLRVKRKKLTNDEMNAQVIRKMWNIRKLSSKAHAQQARFNHINTHTHAHAHIHTQTHTTHTHNGPWIQQSHAQTHENKHKRTHKPQQTDKYACQYIPKIFFLVPPCPLLSRQIIMTNRIRTRDYTEEYSRSNTYTAMCKHRLVLSLCLFMCVCVRSCIHAQVNTHTHTHARWIRVKRG